jgi:hypothetical protein
MPGPRITSVKITHHNRPAIILPGVILWAFCVIAIASRPATGQAQTPATAPAPDVPAGDASKYFPLPPPTDTAQLGVGIQRTMRLLATSTPQHRHHVRVLFYGQSITEQVWSKQVADDLKKRFPDADLDIRNLAIGGFAAQWLIRPAEFDVYPFYPDLVIFHVYGADGEYEQIIKNIRSRTTAEVLMQKDQADAWPQPYRGRIGVGWDAYMNDRFLPATARKYGCGLADVRGEWVDYLKTNHLQPKDLLVADGAHLNSHGNYLMAGIIEQYLVYRPDLPDDSAKTVRDIAIVPTMTQPDGHIKIAFTGNRIDALPASNASPTAKMDVLIDGKHPSDFPEMYAFTRPSPGPWKPLFIKRIDHRQPLVVEHWTYRVDHVIDLKTWTFDVTGSVTGPDGGGTSNKPFLSNSGRVKIIPSDYFRAFNPPLPEGYTESWDAIALFTNTYTPPTITDPALDNATTLAQGLSNGPHTLELIPSAGAANPIAAVRVYEPAVVVKGK